MRGESDWRDERIKREALIAATVRIYGNAFVLDNEHVINPGRVTVYGSLRPPITPDQVEAAARELHRWRGLDKPFGEGIGGLTLKQAFIEQARAMFRAAGFPLEGDSIPTEERT